MDIDRSLVKLGDYSVESGYELMKYLLAMENQPTAIFVTNYELTLGAIMAVNESDVHIPDDVSFIGFDNLQLAKIIKPSLSIVVQPVKQIGEMAANVMLKRLKGDFSNYPVMTRLKTELLINESIKKYSI